MRSEIIRIYKAVHTWTGIVAGMALFIAFYAGSLTVFQEPIARWASPPAEDRMVALDDAQALVVRTLRQRPEAARDFVIHLRQDERISARMSWRVRDAAADDHDELSARHYHAWLDASAQAIVEEVQPSQLGKFIDVLHRVVGLPVDNDPNRWIMGVVAALYALALVSGVIVLLPSLVKDFFALRVGRNPKRMWLDAHNVVGIVSLPFHLVMALTAAVFAFHDGIYYLQDKMLDGGRDGRAPAAAPAMPPDPARMLPPAELVARAQAVAAGFEPYMLQYSGVAGARASVRVWGRDASALSPRALGGFVAIDPYSGRVTGTDYLPGRQDGPHTAVSSFFALHMAAYGGTPVQWMYFVLGLAGAWLFYSGNLLWVESRRRKTARGESGIPAQRRDVRLMAAATVGVCLGCVCGLSLTIAAGKWLHGHAGDLNAWHRYIYYAAFFGCIAWTFARGAAAASVHLLWAAALGTLAIPLTTALAWAVPGLGMWAHGSGAALGVDAIALAGALCLAWMARTTARRVRTGARDSVWSAQRDAAADPPPAAEAAAGRPGMESGPA